VIGLQEDREATPDTPRPAQRGRDEQFTDKQFTENRSERLTAVHQVNSPGRSGCGRDPDRDGDVRRAGASGRPGGRECSRVDSRGDPSAMGGL